MGRIKKLTLKSLMTAKLCEPCDFKKNNFPLRSLRLEQTLLFLPYQININWKMITKTNFGEGMP